MFAVYNEQGVLIYRTDNEEFAQSMASYENGFYRYEKEHDEQC